MASRSDPGQPLLFQAAADPLRWDLLRALAESDRRVGELCISTGRPQNLVSYHLRRLRTVGLVSSRRSSADGRDAYYMLDLNRCAGLFADAAAALHPGLAPDRPRSAAGHEAGGAKEPAASVLFLCTGNSSRSQLAEALLRDASRGRVRAASAGLSPKPVHPHALSVLAERGLDTAGLRSKHLDEVAETRFDYTVTLCDRAREACPDPVPGARAIHWSIPDPAAAGSGPEALEVFRAVAADLQTRTSYLLRAIDAETTKGHIA
ncbi:arsenate reductase/protein-tyrosine-phosphatase family protein [Sinomonas atrocyanea]